MGIKHRGPMPGTGTREVMKAQMLEVDVVFKRRDTVHKETFKAFGDEEVLCIYRREDI